jgi:hypothetical protein
MAERNKAGKAANVLEDKVELDRYEAKYIIHPSLAPEIREFLRAFCVRDPNAAGDPPEYIITTLQLDSETLALHYAKEREAVNRFKLRCRTYGTDGTAPVFIEVKRKIKGTIVKSRVMIPRKYWGPELFSGKPPDIPFRNRHERVNFGEFRRLMNVMDARPVMNIRYLRESYLGAQDDYARVTFDRRLCYCPARGWELPPMGVRWRCMDSATAFNRPFSGVILELKTYRDAPIWMSNLTERFSLERTGFCKYSTAMRMESLFQGALYSEGAENCTYSITGI